MDILLDFLGNRVLSHGGWHSSFRFNTFGLCWDQQSHICPCSCQISRCFLKYLLVSGAAWSMNVLTASVSLVICDDHCPAEQADQVTAGQTCWHNIIAKFCHSKKFTPILHTLSQGVYFPSLQTLKEGLENPFLCDKNKGLQPPFYVYWELCHSVWATEGSTSPPWSEGQRPPSAWVSKAHLAHRRDLRPPSPHFLEALHILYMHLTQIRLSTQCRGNTHGYPCWNKWKWALYSIRDNQTSIEKVYMCSPQNSSPIHRLYWT